MRLLFKVGKLAKVMAVPLWRRALLRHGVAAGVEHRVVLRNLGPVATVLDIGANRGQFALAARQCFPDASIHSFEPLADPAGDFLRVFAADENTCLHRVAIGPRAGEALMHVSRRDDSSSLLPISREQERVFPGTGSIGTRTIAISTLGAVGRLPTLVSPILLKIDVQGYELDALVGCEDLLEKFEWIYVECSFVELYEGQAYADQVIAWLRERGFALVGIYNASYDGGGLAVQADFLFRRSARDMSK
jgi:FkbM family methyltransferase